MTKSIKKRVCLITHHPFWKEPLGCGTLIRGRYQALLEMCDDVFVLFITNTEIKNPLKGGTCKLTGPLTLEHVNVIKDFLAREKIDTCYFSYDQFGIIAEQISCRKIVEIHDVLHLREEQFKKFGYQAPYSISKDTELSKLEKYDVVISLNLDEVDYLSKCGLTQARYLPPFLAYQGDNIKDPETSASGLIASQAKPNLDGLSQLINTRPDFTEFVCAGPICHSSLLPTDGLGNIVNLGMLNDVSEFYNRIKVALSPVRFGGGLKIKTIEALSYGKPVLTTEHAVSGFPPEIRNVVTVEDDLGCWNQSLVHKTAEIQRDAVQNFFDTYFSPSKHKSSLAKQL